MNPSKYLVATQRIRGVNWIPKGVLVFFVILPLILSIDIFYSGYTYPETVEALIIVLWPSVILALVIYASWKRDFIGSMVFLLFFTFSFLFVDPMGYITISLPLFFCSLMLFLSWRKTLRASFYGENLVRDLQNIPFSSEE